MFRFRLYPTTAQEAALLEHCAHARFVWNLCVEQQSWWRPGRKSAPRYPEQARQLTSARREFPWLAAGSHMIQQQALRDFDHAMRRFFDGTNRMPGFRKAARNEGFRVVDVGRDYGIKRLGRRTGAVQVPKMGWVKFRWSRSVPVNVKSYRITRDRAGRWHVAFQAIPDPIPAPGSGEVVGVDRGVTVSAALSTGELLYVPRLNSARRARVRRLQQKLARAGRGSNRRARVKVTIARLRAHDADRRKDWAEKASTDIARRFDLIRIEDLQIRNMTRKPAPRPDPDRPGKYLPNGAAAKAGLDRGILASGWGTLVKRLEEKAPGRVEKINPRFTSQRCSACGHVDPKSRESQADFVCTACKFACNADVNAAINIAAGHAVTARGGVGVTRPVNREPQAA